MGEGALERNFLPNKTYIDRYCWDGLRLELLFPSCWNGVERDTVNHKSHVAYPSLLQEGECPAGFSHRLPALYYETVWNTTNFRNETGRFVLSNGDSTGILIFVYTNVRLSCWQAIAIMAISRMDGLFLLYNEPLTIAKIL